MMMKYNKQHATEFVKCAVGVACSISRSCAQVYIGQTGRVVNDRAREHACAMRSFPPGTLGMHCDRCGCQPAFTRLSILAKSKARATRKLIEAYRIFMAEDTFVCTPSIFLS